MNPLSRCRFPYHLNSRPLSRLLLPRPPPIPIVLRKRLSSKTSPLKRTKITRAPNYKKPEVDPKVLPADEPVEEELLPGYEPNRFCAIDPGDVFDGRYEAVAKIGWGSVSTVWLAKDLKKSKRDSKTQVFVTLKVSTSDAYDKDEARHELAVMQRLHNANPSHRGFEYIRTYDDSFEVETPTGVHVCLVQEPMREPLRQYRCRFKDDKLPPKMVQAFLQCWLAALEYMHEEARVVHTDIKDDNILMTFESPTILSTFASSQSHHPMPIKHHPSGRKTYQAHSSFGPLDSLAVDTRLVDFGTSHRMDGTAVKLFPIQPRYYRAPEVILGSGWSYAADIWNLGVLVFTLLENHHLFHHVNAKDNTYDVKRHLGQMYALLGPLPPKMVQRINENSHGKFEPAMPNDAGEACDNPRDYFGGPYFDSAGEFLFPDMVPEGELSWEGKVHALTDDEGEKAQFLRFVKKMITWDPDERATAKELLEDEWVTRNIRVFK